MPTKVFLAEMTRFPHVSQRFAKCLFQLHFFHSRKRNDEAVLNVIPPLTIVNILRILSMFKTYSHAELGPAAVFGDASTHHWQFVEMEVHHPWFYFELVRDYGDDIVGSMLMIPTVPILQQMLLELDERSWFAQAHLISPSYLTGKPNWIMEPLLEVSLVHDDSGTIDGCIYRVESGACYSIQNMVTGSNPRNTQLIFSAERDLRSG
ncbi:hypothetical protein [Pseudomonas fluorescens]|nr:hypothetical protein [Pseudomonas fluorescens]